MRSPRSLAAVLPLAAVLSLTACSGGDNSGTATALPPVPTTSSAAPTPTETTTPAPEPAPEPEPTTPAAVPTFLDGIEEAWRVPGSTYQVSDDGARILVTRNGHVAIYEATTDESAPIWEAACTSAGFFGERVMCGDIVVDVDTSTVTELPEQGLTYVGATAEYLITQSEAGTTITYDSTLAEVWRRDDITSLGAVGDTNLVMRPDGTLGSVVLGTGQDLGGSPHAFELADGYVIESGDTGLAGYSREGAEVFRVDVTPYRGAAIPLYEETLTLADAEACARMAPSAAPGTLFSDCLVHSGVAVPSDVFEDRVVVEGVEYPATSGDLRLFSDPNYLLLFDSGGAPSTSLYARGTPQPLWSIPAVAPVQFAADQTLLVGTDGTDVTVYRPAG